ncbi:MAG: hypothetical protein IJH39_05600 [Clostridia bacterium]|nr:hypothetical protein [Clostridia bacterium]
MPIVLTGNVEAQFPNTPVLGNLNSSTGANIKGAFIYKNNVITQIYPPVHPVEFAPGNSLGCDNDATAYVSIGIRFYATGDDGKYTTIGGSLPCSVTVKYEYYIITGTAYGGFAQDNYTATASISSGSSSGTYCTSKPGCTVVSFSNGNTYMLYSSGGTNYYIYIMGLAESQYTTSGTYRYSYHLIDINWKTKRISYVGNIYAQPNLFNFTYQTGSYTNYYQYSTWNKNTFPASNNVSSTYFRVYPSTFANTVNTSSIATYTNATGKSRLKMYFNVNNNIKIPNMGFKLNTSYEENLSSDVFGYFFNAYITLNQVIPFTNDPMSPSTGSLFDYNGTTKVSRYKINNLQSNGWTTVQTPKVWLLGPWYPYQIWPPASTNPTNSQILASIYTPNDNLSSPIDHSSDRFIFILISTSSYLTFVVSGADELSNGTHTINSSNRFYGTENYGGTSGGALGYIDAGGYMSLPIYSSSTYPSGTGGQAFAKWTNSKQTNYYIYSGMFSHPYNLLNYIYGPIRCELTVKNTLMSNNYHYKITGTKQTIDWFSTYNKSQTLYIYYIGNSNQSTKKITYWAKQVATITLNSQECAWDYTITSKQW